MSEQPCNDRGSAAYKTAHVCDLGLPCGPCMRAERAVEARRAPADVPPRRYRNTEGLRGHANARKRADS